MMADKIPHNALVVMADGTGARFFRNADPPHSYPDERAVSQRS